jgi:peptidoglycan L-alanyl-D-glutamate endopeptidase CwlK
MGVLRLGSAGSDVAALQQALVDHGFPPGAIDGVFGPGTHAAVIAFQQFAGLQADGVVGTQTAAALGLSGTAATTTPGILPGVTVPIVSKMFPGAPVHNIEQHLPVVLQALVDVALVDKPIVVMSLATIRAETAGFAPISESPNQYNTSPGGAPFDLYDNRADLGNLGPPDGEQFRGRGFIQLTGRANYERHGNSIGIPDLVVTPDQANDPNIAARLLASFVKASEQRIRSALVADDLATARRLVNGGTHGIDAFTDAYRIGQQLIPDVEVAS